MLDYVKDEFERIWEQLTQKRPHVNNRLEQVRIQNIRGIVDISIRFPYQLVYSLDQMHVGKQQFFMH